MNEREGNFHNVSIKTFRFLMNKIAQYENNMIYIVKKQEGFFKTRSNPASFPPVPLNLRNLKVVQTHTQSEKVLDCYEKGKHRKSPKWHQTKAPVRWIPFSLLHGAKKKPMEKRGRLLVPMRNSHAGLGCSDVESPSYPPDKSLSSG